MQQNLADVATPNELAVDLRYETDNAPSFT